MKQTQTGGFELWSLLISTNIPRNSHQCRERSEKRGLFHTNLHSLLVNFLTIKSATTLLFNSTSHFSLFGQQNLVEAVLHRPQYH